MMNTKQALESLNKTDNDILYIIGNLYAELSRVYGFLELCVEGENQFRAKANKELYDQLSKKMENNLKS